jgi:hypothetical protein
MAVDVDKKIRYLDIDDIPEGVHTPAKSKVALTCN